MLNINPNSLSLTVREDTLEREDREGHSEEHFRSHFPLAVWTCAELRETVTKLDR